jgi:signal transduction histidine kinase
VEITIADRGPGIRPQDMPHIFKRFRRFATTAAIGDAPASGNGLGLAFARAAVRKAGGQIRCRSTVGVGTTFTIVLPVK